jgi:hypothetical protein
MQQIKLFAKFVPQAHIVQQQVLLLSLVQLETTVQLARTFLHYALMVLFVQHLVHLRLHVLQVHSVCQVAHLLQCVLLDTIV